jgi:release factor glutamine methyltransferase
MRQAQYELHTRLLPLYGEREAAQIADWVMENITGQKKIDRIVNRDLRLSPVQLDIFWQYIKGLAGHKPVQYVLHESWFCGYKFYVDEHVLIPRPETEELVEWVASTIDDKTTPTGEKTLLDIGTGSGCIAISLKKLRPQTSVHACDVSSGALTVARRNATDLSADVSFHRLDILDKTQRTTLPPLDIIVSNPPYIPLRDKAAMSPHVLDHEPHLALFVHDEDPLIFYQAIADLGRERLPPGGKIFAEIHEELAAPTLTLFHNAGYTDIVVKTDMQGKERMISATR